MLFVEDLVNVLDIFDVSLDLLDISKDLLDISFDNF